MPPFLANLLKNTKALVALGLAFVLLLVVWLYGTFNSAQKTMVTKETALGAQYNECQNTLDNFVKSIKEALGIADRTSDKLDTVLSDVVKGRYQTGSTANPTGGSAFSAIVEAYPALNGMTVNYANVQSAIFAGRDGFKNCQTELLDRVRDYKAWKDSDIFKSKVNAMVGAPSSHLEARIGDNVVHGQDALNRIERIVSSEETDKAYQTGKSDPIDTNPQAPAPATTPAQ